MKQEKIQDSSTVRFLTPASFHELKFAELKYNLRYQGSFRLNLRRPSKTSAYSRNYVPGDPLNLIDWKVFARTDQLLIREELDESSSKVMICLDIADTMQWPTTEMKGFEGMPAQMEIAQRLAMNLAFIHFRMADMVSLILWQPGKQEPERMIPVRSSSDVLKVFNRMEGRSFNESGLLEESEDFVFNHRPADIVYWVSDGLGASRVPWLSEFSRKFRFVHCLSSKEIDVSWMNADYCYFDHSERKKEYLGIHLTESTYYQESVDSWRKRLIDEVRKAGGAYQLVTEATSIRSFQSQLVEYA